MPRYLKFVYAGGIALAVIATLLGSYEVFIAADPSASLGSDVLLPLGALAIIVALYARRKREMDKR
ncbi:MAG: hypothetical protein WD021_05865 [Rhodothermales bacterium]